MNLLEELSAQKKSSTNQDGLKNDWINEPSLLGCIRNGWQHGQTRLHLGMNWGKGVYVFLLERELFFFFAYSSILFIKWNLRDFSPCWLQPSLNIACLCLLSFKAFLHILGIQGCFSFLFFFLVCFLPTVMDPSSVIIRLFFFCTFMIHIIFGHANLDICQVLWILDSFVVPT